MRVHVDEPRRDDEPARVDDPSGGDIIAQTAHRGDPIAADRHVPLEPGIAGAVDDLAAADHDVVGLAGPVLAGGESGRGPEGQEHPSGAWFASWSIVLIGASRPPRENRVLRPIR